LTHLLQLLDYVLTAIGLPAVILRRLRDRDLEDKLLELLLVELLLDEETQAVLKVEIWLAAAGLHSLGARATFSAFRPGRTTVFAATGRAAFATFFKRGPNVIVV